ncbi:hypothetical protein PMNALOAF_3645 [Methylobacterium adhaesivum]|jgi:hypothetical protein|uniref:Cysteine rich repeat-containing protein n=1 Tax=Methylobacterium adhaesivum TaxID=333297 RepID=A0ABT8BE65_9HYPH|nr:cysteine rich repeat-containing protein [Methylobacterium adhaesivum]MDN3590387.1 cysteine rich repeat-containing protein [Methylobacterium adhaesivum]GJD32376.1 hypothetical protein PMNALOAF_3645 [Methylobacterium adhaesivum]
MSRVIKTLLAFGLGLAPLAAQADPAAMRDVLKRSCTGDYFEFCGDHAPGGPEVEACFRTNMKNLSSACASAITAFKREQKVKRVSEAN